MTLYEFGPERRAQIYALVSWNGKNMKEALQMAETTTFEELDKQVWSQDSINKAKNGIENRKEDLLGDKKFDAIVEICADIHDNWVQTNAKKYDRGTKEKSDKKLYQHLPTAMIGMDEVALDLMFLAPFLEEMGIDAGVMSKDAYGKFVPSPEVEKAYKEYVETFNLENGIKSYETMKDKLPKIIEEYAPLQPQDELGEKRIDYMNDNIGLLANEVQGKNPNQFSTAKVK